MSFRILALVLGIALPGQFFAKVNEIKKFNLVGVIENQGDPLGKSIIVIKDSSTEKSMTILANDPLPGTSLCLKQISRHYLVYSDGVTEQHLVKADKSTNFTLQANNQGEEESPVSEETLRAETELIWERLRQKSTGQELKVEMDQDSITAEAYYCDETGCTDDSSEIDVEY